MTQMKRKRCAKCRRLRRAKFFSLLSTAKDKLQVWCRDCQKNWPRKSKAKQQRRLENLRRFGFTPEMYDKLYRQQNGKCAICLTPSKYTLHGDHNHATGKPRALLCWHCNLGLGLFKDNAILLEQAAKYLQKYA